MMIYDTLGFLGKDCVKPTASNYCYLLLRELGSSLPNMAISHHLTKAKAIGEFHYKTYLLMNLRADATSSIYTNNKRKCKHN